MKVANISKFQKTWQNLYWKKEEGKKRIQDKPWKTCCPALFGIFCILLQRSTKKPSGNGGKRFAKFGSNPKRPGWTTQGSPRIVRLAYRRSARGWQSCHASTFRSTVALSITPRSLSVCPWKMVVGSNLSYWEGNFSGARLSFGRLSLIYWWYIHNLDLQHVLSQIPFISMFCMLFAEIHPNFEAVYDASRFMRLIFFQRITHVRVDRFIRI